MILVEIYRYNPEQDRKPHMQRFEIDDRFRTRMVLDVLEQLKSNHPSITYRRSCREGVCGSDGMNINGKNGLACITSVADAMGNKTKLILRPLPGMPVIRDLVVDQTHFFEQYAQVRPYLINNTPAPSIERKQTPEERKKLDGLYEWILCGCCTSACPSWWWNPKKYLGPAVLLQAYRFLVDSRDTSEKERLEDLEDPFSVFRCRQIENCTYVCPKHLNPMKAITKIKQRLLKKSWPHKNKNSQKS